jgi:hypothetical protein
MRPQPDLIGKVCPVHNVIQQQKAERHPSLILGGDDAILQLRGKGAG